MKYFTQKEIQDFKNGSINYPFLIVEKEQDEVIQVSEVVSIGGMANNNGTPTSIGIQVHRIGKEVEHLRYVLEK
jgi:hypothetical protein